MINTIEKITDIVVPEILSEFKEQYHDQHKWDRCIKELKKVFRQVKESETFKDKVAFEDCDDSAFTQFMIEPSLSIDEMQWKLRWYFDEYLSCDDWNTKESVEKYICQTYLTAVGKEITEKDLMTQLRSIKNYDYSDVTEIEAYYEEVMAA